MYKTADEYIQMELGKGSFILKHSHCISAYEKVLPPQRGGVKVTSGDMRHQWIRCRPTVPLKLGSSKEP